MKKFKEFLNEAAKIVGHVKVTHFGKRKKGKRNSYTTPEKIPLTPEQHKQMDVVIDDLNSIAGKYGASFDPEAVKGHLRKRINERGFSMSDLTRTFKNLEKRTTFFKDLKKLAKIGQIGFRSKRYGPQILDAKRKIQFGTVIESGGKNIVVRTVLEKWKPDDQIDMKRVGIKHYYAD